MNKVFAGDADAAPATVPASGTAVALVSSAPAAIALIRLADVKDVVKVVKIDGYSPTDAAYPIR